MILNTGDIPNLYEHDEKTEIVERVCIQMKIFTILASVLKVKDS